ncbi:uncharacterized protein K02A2.6-like [Cyprinodon tularosa]|uniref:uncharacterized protein K02A2.6-like n=1 Tax=Cyprinodon tularosa TaxID=77115 RepID=UPI0018E28EBB|nr:uncharacterized protein K02A2.6-like [Cyprinodon tularosa]
MHLDMEKRGSSTLKQQPCQDASALQQQDVGSWLGPQHGVPQHAEPGNRHEFKGDPGDTQFLSQQVREDGAASEEVVQCGMEAALNFDTVPDLTLDSPNFGLFEMNTDDCRLWGLRVVVPKKLRDQLISELHEHHWGIVKMKPLARSLFWWPAVDECIEQEVSECTICQKQRSMPCTAPVHKWKWAASPWERIHLDFAEDHKQMFLVVMDAYARWPEIIPMHTTTSLKTIEALRNLFAAYGFPKEVVTDNGPQFVSQEFEYFLKKNGVQHIKSPAYHPASNGLAERLVQNLKKSLAKNRAIGGMSLEHCVANFLLGYRNTPHTTTGKTPAELFLKRQVRTRLSLIRPQFSQRMQNKTEPPLPRVRVFTVGQPVLVKNYRGGEKWLNGVIREILGPVTYSVEVNGKCVKKHVNQMLGVNGNPAQWTQTDSCTGNFWNDDVIYSFL